MTKVEPVIPGGTLKRNLTVFDGTTAKRLCVQLWRDIGHLADNISEILFYFWRILTMIVIYFARMHVIFFHFPLYCTTNFLYSLAIGKKVKITDVTVPEMAAQKRFGRDASGNDLDGVVNSSNSSTVIVSLKF